MSMLGSIIQWKHDTYFWIFRRIAFQCFWVHIFNLFLLKFSPTTFNALIITFNLVQLRDTTQRLLGYVKIFPRNTKLLACLIRLKRVPCSVVNFNCVSHPSSPSLEASTNGTCCSRSPFLRCREALGYRFFAPSILLRNAFPSP